VRYYQHPERLAALVEEYPVLARLLAQAAGRAVDGHLELARRYAADRAALVTTLFGGTDPGPLTAITVAGDGHRGRAVSIVRFASGARAVYKPRSLSVHGHFNDVVGWLNGKLPGLGLRRLRLVERDCYGWQEYAEHLPCPDGAAVARYYHRQGALLALLYVLDAADVHFENVVASGDQPVLVDLEALLHPRIPPAADWVTGDPAMLALAASVHRVGLLPRLTVGDRGAIDLSGLGAEEGATLPAERVAWAEAGTDMMTLTRAPARLTGGQHRPRVGDADADPDGYAIDLLAGFRDAYDAIARDRDELAGLLRRFAGDEVRIIARPTRTYARLLDESTHPDVMRDALDRDRIFDHLWAASAGDPVLERLVPYEVAELWAGDVPMFTGRPGSSLVWTGSRAPLAGILTSSSIEAAAARMRALGPADRERQEWVIRAAFAARSGAPRSTGHRWRMPDPSWIRIGWSPPRVAWRQRSSDSGTSMGGGSAGSVSTWSATNTGRYGRSGSTSSAGTRAWRSSWRSSPGSRASSGTPTWPARPSRRCRSSSRRWPATRGGTVRSTACPVSRTSWCMSPGSSRTRGSPRR
jgi:type 2 lantibiotic biosynthesis protein LanM